MKKDVLGVEIDDLSMDQAVDMVKVWLKEGGKHFIVTPNPEFIMAAQKDEAFRRVLNEADLAIPDGVALKALTGFKNVVGGVYLLEDLCRLAAEKGLTTGFLGGKDGVAKKAAECLQRKYPGLKVVMAEDGPEVDKDGHVINDSLLTDNEKIINPQSLFVNPVDILFVGFGQVKQEKWIAQNLAKLPVKVAMGVGGSFDEISGKVPRAPHWIHHLGLKWLFRLVIQPWRFKRQLKIWQFAWVILTKGDKVKE